MRTRVLTILALSIILAACVGVDGQPITIPNGQGIYDLGFRDGCAASIFFLTSPQSRPPYDDALVLCARVREAAQQRNLQMLARPEPEPTPCSGGCI